MADRLPALPAARPALAALAMPALARQLSPLRKPSLRVEIPRSGLGQGSCAPSDAAGHDRLLAPGGAHAHAVSTPVTPVGGAGQSAPHDEMFSDASPAAKLGDEIARLRVGQQQAGGGALGKPRRAPAGLGRHEDLDEGSGEVVIDIPLDVSPYIDMFLRAPPPSQGRVLCCLESAPRPNGETLFTLTIEESGVILLVALRRPPRGDVLIGLYERELEAHHLGTLRSDEAGIFVLEGAHTGSGSESPVQYACAVHGTHQAGDMPVMNMMEVAVPSRPFLEAARADGGARPPPSPGGVMAWPAGELERWLREHDDSLPQVDASLLTMRLPKWNPVTKLLTLNFYDRASVASAQNFQLTPFGDPEKAVLLFGKRSERLYSLDFMAPLSPFAALGIALTTVDW